MDPVAVRFLRGDTVESVHRVSVAVTDAHGREVGSFGDPGFVTFLRSAAKPLQAIPLVETGAAGRFGFTARELAIIAGSHSGEEEHVAVVEGILAKIGLGADALQCGRHAPYNKEAADRVGANFTAIHHNCSGKHSGMLALALHLGADTRTYLAPEHPVQSAILEAVAAECGLKPGQVALGTDGCGVPSFAVPLHGAARAFARLTNAEEAGGRRATTLGRIRDAMLGNPRMVAGTNRLDTDLMEALRGRLVLKAGAEACYAAGLAGRGIGICVKVEDGNPRAVGPALVRVLDELGEITPAQKEAVAKHWNEPVRNVAGRVVGRIECDFELRRPRRRLATAA